MADLEEMEAPGEAEDFTMSVTANPTATEIASVTGAHATKK